jgi:DNA polymerase (family 10)
MLSMDNQTIAHLLDETASLLEISGGDSFRIRSYHRGAEAVEQATSQLSEIAVKDDALKQLQQIPGIGKGLAAHVVEMVSTGHLTLRDDLLKQYSPTILELLKLPGMGPKTVALLWDSNKIGDVDALEAAAKAGKLDHLPRFGHKLVEKILKGIEEYRRHSGRFRIDVADEAAAQLTRALLKIRGVDTVTPAGSLRRGRETVGDLDLLVSGSACEEAVSAATAKKIAALDGIATIIAKGTNKVSFLLANGLQVDVRLLPRASYGAALQYFTGSKSHSVVLRQRALKMGYTLNEYALSRVSNNSVVAAAKEKDIYTALGLDYIPPELRENLAEIEAAEHHKLPKLIEQKDIRGDLHMHTDATDGHNTIREMAEAALERSYEYIAITDHSKNLAMTNGLNDRRALEHVHRIRQVDKEMKGSIRVLAGIEVDILADGALDLSDNVLAEMEIVIASVHTLFNQPADQMTKRILRAVEHPQTRILGHPSGRLLLRREPFAFDLKAVLRRCASLGVAVEHNAAPERLDLSDRNLRLAHELGCKIVVDTDSHRTTQLDNMRFGLLQLRRAWLTPSDVLNTLPLKKLLSALRPKP